MRTMPSSIRTRTLTLALSFASLVLLVDAIGKKNKKNKERVAEEVPAAPRVIADIDNGVNMDEMIAMASSFLLGTLQLGVLPVVGKISAKTLHIFGRACFVANAKLSTNAKLGDAMVYSYIVYVLTAYGGGVLCPLLLGKSPKPLESDTILVISFAAFILFTRMGFKAVYNFPPVTLIGLVLENAFKGGLIVTFFTAAKSSLGTMLGPLIVGTIAGCGGAVIWGPAGWGKASGHVECGAPSRPHMNTQLTRI
mmetsp:Transcript_31127/g.53633  ORF Transcript_31127/g.53633 Transcript_31127/m.53633 type:complete len:252 (+) Transcript_31127:134-889(+)